ncbi:hypothetical protein ACLB1N_16170 [Escherichia coli]
MARRILVVEDEAPIREMVCFVLEQNGFQPVEAEDYDSAVNQLNEPWPDLILTGCYLAAPVSSSSNTSSASR